MGVVGSPGCYRTRMCPSWITSLQQAELYAAYWATQIAVYKGARSVTVGPDNDAARAQLSALSASVACVNQLRVLRRMFWLQAWSHVEPSFFRVDSALNRSPEPNPGFPTVGTCRGGRRAPPKIVGHESGAVWWFLPLSSFH